MESFHWKVSFVLLTQPTAICHLLYQCKLQTFIGVASSKMVIGHDVFVRRACRITRGILSIATAAVHFLRLVQQPDHKRQLTYDHQYCQSTKRAWSGRRREKALSRLRSRLSRDRQSVNSEKSYKRISLISLWRPVEKHRSTCRAS